MADWQAPCFLSLSYNLVPKLAATAATAAPLEGASAGVMAIAIGTTALAPDYRIFPMLNGGIPLMGAHHYFRDHRPGQHCRWIQWQFCSPCGRCRHWLLFVYRMRKGKDWSVPMNKFFNWIGNLFNPERGNWKKTAKYELHYKSNNAEPYKKIPNITQKRIDEILDKINQQGYRFLTDEERDILKRAAEDDDL